MGRSHIDEHISGLMRVLVRPELVKSDGACVKMLNSVNEMAVAALIDNVLDLAIRGDSRSMLDMLSMSQFNGSVLCIRSYLVEGFIDSNKDILYFDDYWSLQSTLTSNISRYTETVAKRYPEEFKLMLFELYENLSDIFYRYPLRSYSVTVINNTPCVIVVEDKPNEKNINGVGERHLKDYQR